MSTLIERLKNPEDHYEFSDPKKANAVLMSLCQEAADALADIKQDLTPVQPVAWYRDEDGIRIYYESKCWDDATPLYTTPPAAITQEELQDLKRSEREGWRYASELEQERKRLTAPPAPVQEPWEPHDTAHRPGGLPQDFIKHEVENEGDWSEWVNPKPEQYFMKCCDCGLVHEMQFKIAKYSEGDECEFVADADLQAVFRARRTAPPAPVQEHDEWLTGCPECGMDSGCDCDSGTWNPPAQPAPVQPEPCCGKYETCTQACAPRGKFLAKREAQAAPTVQEPVAYQQRTRPNWMDETCWTPWEDCSKSEAEDCWNRPRVHDWLYEARALYTTPPAQPAPVQEPVGRVCFEGDEVVWTDEPPESGTLLYTPPPAQSAPECTRSHPHENMDAMCELRTEIARLTNENARLKAQPAPASWMEMVVANLVREGVSKHKARELAEHFYSLAQRQFVGLTDEELELLNDCGDTDSYKFARAIEAKLKEKNGM